MFIESCYWWDSNQSFFRFENNLKNVTEWKSGHLIYDINKLRLF